MSESPEDMISRVRMMSEDNGTSWDLSPNDQAALKYVLSELSSLANDVADCRSSNMVYDVQQKALDLLEKIGGPQ